MRKLLIALLLILLLTSSAISQSNDTITSNDTATSDDTTTSNDTTSDDTTTSNDTTSDDATTSNDTTSDDATTSNDTTSGDTTSDDTSMEENQTTSDTTNETESEEVSETADDIEIIETAEGSVIEIEKKPTNICETRLGKSVSEIAKEIGENRRNQVRHLQDKYHVEIKIAEMEKVLEIARESGASDEELANLTQYLEEVRSAREALNQTAESKQEYDGISDAVKTAMMNFRDAARQLDVLTAPEKIQEVRNALREIREAKREELKDTRDEAKTAAKEKLELIFEHRKCILEEKINRLHNRGQRIDTLEAQLQDFEESEINALNALDSDTPQRQLLRAFNDSARHVNAVRENFNQIRELARQNRVIEKSQRREVVRTAASVVRRSVTDFDKKRLEERKEKAVAARETLRTISARAIPSGDKNAQRPALTTGAKPQARGVGA
ncbi:MAG: hypothetical protein J4432_02795 [DPANN group archaeon]|nr:hypothetical protein [DPANN group archaeon]